MYSYETAKFYDGNGNQIGNKTNGSIYVIFKKDTFKIVDKHTISINVVYNNEEHTLLLKDFLKDRIIKCLGFIEQETRFELFLSVTKINERVRYHIRNIVPCVISDNCTQKAETKVLPTSSVPIPF